jgi:hypothetical protein
MEEHWQRKIEGEKTRLSTTKTNRPNGQSDPKGVAISAAPSDGESEQHAGKSEAEKTKQGECITFDSHGC